MLKSKTLKIPNACQDVEQHKLAFIVGGNAKWYSHIGRNLAVSQNTEHSLTIQSSNCSP